MAVAHIYCVELFTGCAPLLRRLAIRVLAHGMTRNRVNVVTATEPRNQWRTRACARGPKLKFLEYRSSFLRQNVASAGDYEPQSLEAVISRFRGDKMTAPLIRSATKRQFLIQLGLDPNDVRTSETYWMLKVRARDMTRDDAPTDVFCRTRLPERTKPSFKAEAISCGQSTPAKTLHTQQRISRQKHLALLSGPSTQWLVQRRGPTTIEAAWHKEIIG
ncbi:MAG: hypothetical protein Q9196_006604 [Gyalolechia fulgens]